ncbi:TPA: hypothetical protein N0F65_007120 [Lagenidium giganteum]|uniref:DDE Tnp4 domain-containing protein n=1 Tax=Lagenidium giganteum TaxID=4803 RepID=A0AAV2YSV7_9STRA|nr:TPA: hypothetical protein N0F65_007120 [Lagenidium giganteum]
MYGDPAYLLTASVVRPYHSQGLTDRQRKFNRVMSGVRISVEWIFGELVARLGVLDFRKSCKVFLSPMAKFDLVAALLTNCKRASLRRLRQARSKGSRYHH